MSNSYLISVFRQSKSWVSIFIICSSSFIVNVKGVNILDFGADNTGEINISPLINNLIDSLAQNKGGTIFIPVGTYFSGPIIMKSNISNCNTVLINGLQLYNPTEQFTAIQLNDCNNFEISNCFQVEPISTFLKKRKL